VNYKYFVVNPSESKTLLKLGKLRLTEFKVISIAIVMKFYIDIFVTSDSISSLIEWNR
jgi:hypothetical protein